MRKVVHRRISRQGRLNFNVSALTDFSQIDLRPHCSGKIWKYLNVESDGLIDVVDWGQDGQLWAPSRNEDGSFCIRSTHGKYLRAKENGQVVLGDDCDVNARFVIEAFPW